MAINYAEQLANEGDVDKARAALEYVDTFCRSSAIDTADIIERIINKSAAKEPAAVKEAAIVREVGLPSPEPVRSWYDRNMEVIKRRYPDVFERLASTLSTSDDAVIVKPSQYGPAVFRRGVCLDHADKPQAAADAWVARSMQEKRVVDSGHLVALGFGGGYHLETMLLSSKRVSCIEPSLQAFKAALESRDLHDVLEKIDGLSVGAPAQLSFLGTDSELLVRPQHFALDADFVNGAKRDFYGQRGLGLLKPKIAVLGPLQGGTGPIAQYTYSGLSRLGQRVRGIDMTGFNPAFELLDGFVEMDIRKNLLRSAYVEMLSLTLLETFHEKPVDVLICMAQAPVNARLLTELRKRGVITVLWFVEDYLRFTYWREMAQYYDFIFTIQDGECLQALKGAGAGEVQYLPMACDPYFHVPLNLSAEDRAKWGSPISFVGAGYHNRQQTFASLSSLPFKIWGSEWPGCKPFDRMVQEQSRRIAPEEYLKIFNSTDINLNLHSSTERDGVDPTGDFVNPRTFELASCGAFQLVDERRLLPDLFEPGKELVTFNSLSDLKDKIHYYQDRPEERREIAQNGRVRALRDHSYDRRLQQMLSIIYSTKFEQLKAREQSSPWTKMIDSSKPYPELHDRCKKAFERGEEPALDALISDIVTGKGKLTETEQKLLFLFHIRKQIVRMAREEVGDTRKT
jgi:spore maturation protein CgeB